MTEQAILHSPLNHKSVHRKRGDMSHIAKSPVLRVPTLQTSENSSGYSTTPPAFFKASA